MLETEGSCIWQSDELVTLDGRIEDLIRSNGPTQTFE
jgi:hypothetical protein